VTHIPRTDHDQWCRRLNATLAFVALVLTSACAFSWWWGQ
jgi:hypothetical protein